MIKKSIKGAFFISAFFLIVDLSSREEDELYEAAKNFLVHIKCISSGTLKTGYDFEDIDSKQLNEVDYFAFDDRLFFMQLEWGDYINTLVSTKVPPETEWKAYLKGMDFIVNDKQFLITLDTPELARSEGKIIGESFKLTIKINRTTGTISHKRRSVSRHLEDNTRIHSNSVLTGNCSVYEPTESKF